MADETVQTEERRRPGVYQRLNAGGTPRHMFSGVEATLVSGDAASDGPVTWGVALATIGRLVPKEGDRMRDVNGDWWVVAEVGEPSDGVFPCACQKLTTGGDD